MANIPGLPVLARLLATAILLVVQTKKVKVWLAQVAFLISQNKTLQSIGYRARLTLRVFQPNWHASSGIVALLMLVLITNIVVVRAQEDSREFLDVEPEMATQILDEVAPYTPFDEDLEQAKLATAGETEGFVLRPDFRETRKAGFSYTVQGGDTLQKIAERSGVTVATLLDVNQIAVKDITNIKPGTVLQIPPYNTSESTAWLEEAQKIAQAKAEARQRAEQKRRLVLARTTLPRGSEREEVEEVDAHFDGESEDCSINPVPQRKRITRGISRRHQGIDITAPHGAPILAAKTGVVKSMGWRRGYGKTLIVSTGSGEEQTYAHTSGFADVKPGQTVEQGQVIAYIGSTGYSTGPHLHIEERVKGSVVNPFKC